MRDLSMLACWLVALAAMINLMVTKEPVAFYISAIYLLAIIATRKDNS